MADGFVYSPEVIEERRRIGRVNVELVGRDGNAFAIMGRVQRAMKQAGYSQKAISEYQQDSTSDTYDHLLRVAMEWTNDLGEDLDEEVD